MEDVLGAELTRELEAFLESEHDMLLGWRDAVRDMRAGLLQGDVSAGAESLQSHTRRDTAQHAQRMELQRQLAARMNLAPSQVRLSLVEQHLDEDARRRVAGQRQRLQALLREIRIVTNSNAALILQTTNVLNRAIQAVTRNHASGSTYDAAGKLRRDRDLSVVRRVC